MPGGDADAYKFIEPIVTKVAAQVSSDASASDRKLCPAGSRTITAGASVRTSASKPVLIVQVDDGPCVMHVGPGGAGNFVKMVHNGIEYGDMQLISEAYDILRTVRGFTNDELAETFTLWNKVLQVCGASCPPWLIRQGKHCIDMAH